MGIDSVYDMFQDKVINFVTDPGNYFFLLYCIFLNMYTGKSFLYYYFTFHIIFYNRNCDNFVVIVFPVCKINQFYAIAPVVNFFLEMVNFYFRFLNCSLV